MTDLAPGLPNIPCTALDLVIENLLLNSVKAMQDRPGQLIVRSWLDERLPREPFVVITVQDEGVGMTEDQLSRLFEPRRTGTRGSGLGFGGGGGRRKGGGDVTGPKMEDLDADKDGEVTRDELAAYYRKKGFVPYQFQLSPPAASFNIARNPNDRE